MYTSISVCIVGARRHIMTCSSGVPILRGIFSPLPLDTVSRDKGKGYKIELGFSLSCLVGNVRYYLCCWQHACRCNMLHLKGDIMPFHAF